jgi:hypothetical protein
MHRIRSRRGTAVLALLTLLTVIGLISTPHAAGHTTDYVWTIQEVEPNGGHGTSLVLDSQGWPPYGYWR